MKKYAKKFAAEPSCEAMLDAPNWFLTMMPIDPAKFVTKAIMKKRANMIAIAATLPLLWFSDMVVVPFIVGFNLGESLADFRPFGKRGSDGLPFE